MSVSYHFARPHQAFEAGFFQDRDFDYGVRCVLGAASAGASEPGEVLATIAGIRDGDLESWHGAWLDLGRRLAALGEELRDADRFDGASSAFLRASSYLSIAVDSAPDDEVAAVFAEQREAWDSFVDTTVYLVERVDIPYEGATLPGYFMKPQDDDEAQPTLILNNGSDGSHAAMWADAASGALARGYSVLFFDGPGQQSMLFEHGMPFRPDWEAVLTPVVDFLLDRDDVDPERLAVYGISQAGFWVPRALAFERRIAAAIVDPGVVDVAASWLPNLPASLVRLFEEGRQDAFDRDMALGMRLSPSAARTWAFRARPYGTTGFFETLTEVQRYSLGDEVAKISTPLFITSPEDEQFWPGQSERLAESLTVEHVLQPFTAAEGANYHCQPLARALTQQRMFDWLDAQFSR